MPSYYAMLIIMLASMFDTGISLYDPKFSQINLKICKTRKLGHIRNVYALLTPLWFQKMAETIRQNKPLGILYSARKTFSLQNKELTSYEAMKICTPFSSKMIDKQIDNELCHFVSLSGHVIL